MIIVCPVCEVADYTVTDTRREQYIPYYGDLSVSIKDYFCNNCGFQGDFSEENDLIFTIAKDAAILCSVNTMIAKINEAGFSNVAVERAMRLNPRTLTRWTTGVGLTEEAVALLRLLANNPNLIRGVDQDGESS